jgi:RNA polymerase sigma-70 factor, ECF subfamily
MARHETDFRTDSELFARLSDEHTVSERAFAELYARYSGRVYSFCLRFLGDPDEAKDVYQDTFIRFYQSASRERDMSNVPGFLLTIARNLCLNAKRDRKPTVTVEDVEAALAVPGPEQREFTQLVTVALEMLPDDYREVFVLREYEGLTYAEIADIIHASLPTVKVRIFRAKQRLRQILTPYLMESGG